MAFALSGRDVHGGVDKIYSFVLKIEKNIHLTAVLFYFLYKSFRRVQEA